jgi:acyl carrier protein
MTSAEAERRAREVVARSLGRPAADGAGRVPLVEQGFDSAAAVHVLEAVERAFDLIIPDEELLRLATFEDLIICVARRATDAGAR